MLSIPHRIDFGVTGFHRINTQPIIAILGGTGKKGSGLAFRWARAGYKVIIGSRDETRASDMAATLNKLLRRDVVRGLTNSDAARLASAVVLAVPHSVQTEIAIDVSEHLQGKILVDITAPKYLFGVDHIGWSANASAAAALQAQLGPGVRVVAAFQNISAHRLHDPDHKVNCDVLVFGNNVNARERVIAMAESAGMRGLHAGRIVDSIAAEAIASLLCSICRNYNVDAAGIRVTGLPL